MSSATHLAFRIARYAVVFCTLIGTAAGLVYAYILPGPSGAVSAMSVTLPVGALAGLIVGMVLGAMCVVVAATWMESKPETQESDDTDD